MIYMYMDINEYSSRPIRSWSYPCRSTSLLRSGELFTLLTSKQKNILLRNHGLEIQTNQVFKFLIHADYVLYYKITIINEDDFDHDEKGLRG